MNDKMIKYAFNRIHADEQLKSKTKAAVQMARDESKNKSGFVWLRYTAAAVCLMFVCVLCLGIVSYNIEVGAISLDINPSIELGINRYDRVISVESFNDDGKRLIDAVNVNNMTYEQALDTILDCDEAKSYTRDNNIIAVTVETDSEQKTQELMTGIESCHHFGENMYCKKSDPQDREEAHSLNLSFGKYNAYIELRQYEPDITPEEIRDMSMKEIHSRIEACKHSDSQDDNTQNKTDTDNTSHHGSQYGSGKKHRNKHCE